MNEDLKSEVAGYVINLDSRQDRWSDYLLGSRGITIPVQRVSAVDANNLSGEVLHVPAVIAACWMSHQKVAALFLRGQSQYCLVMEDDVLLSEEALIFLNSLSIDDFDTVDLLQIGFCVHGNRLANRDRYSAQRKLILGLNFFNLLDTSLCQKLVKHFYGKEFTRLGSSGLPVVKNSFELGTHAYLMSRRFAQRVLDFNTPVFLPADLAFIELVETKNFDAFRLLKSVIKQSDSPSSISDAAYRPLALETTLFRKTADE